MAFLDVVENHKMVVENSGLLTVAALNHLDVKNKKIVSILSGGNMDIITMSSVVQFGLRQRDRIFTVSGQAGRTGADRRSYRKGTGKCYQTGSQPVCQHKPKCGRGASHHSGGIRNGA